MNVWPLTCCMAAFKARVRIGGMSPDLTRSFISFADARTDERLLRSTVIIS